MGKMLVSQERCNERSSGLNGYKMGAGNYTRTLFMEFSLPPNPPSSLNWPADVLYRRPDELGGVGPP